MPHCDGLPAGSSFFIFQVILQADGGLSRWLQGITLIWTLLHNGHESLGGSPIAKRIIICCPTSLVSNWDSECNKWLKVGSPHAQTHAQQLPDLHAAALACCLEC